MTDTDANPFVGTNWQVRSDTPPPTPATDEREAVARALCNDRDEGEEPCSVCRGMAATALSALAPNRSAEILAAERERDALREALRNALASLVAATSLLERGGKKAAPSDKMFAQMLVDYNKSAAAARAALTANHSEHGAGK